MFTHAQVSMCELKTAFQIRTSYDADKYNTKTNVMIFPFLNGIKLFVFTIGQRNILDYRISFDFHFRLLVRKYKYGSWVLRLKSMQNRIQVASVPSKAGYGHWSPPPSPSKTEKFWDHLSVLYIAQR